MRGGGGGFGGGGGGGGGGGPTGGDATGGGTKKGPGTAEPEKPAGTKGVGASNIDEERESFQRDLAQKQSEFDNATPVVGNDGALAGYRVEYVDGSIKVYTQNEFDKLVNEINELNKKLGKTSVVTTDQKKTNNVTEQKPPTGILEKTASVQGLIDKCSEKAGEEFFCVLDSKDNMVRFIGKSDKANGNLQMVEIKDREFSGVVVIPEKDISVNGKNSTLKEKNCTLKSPFNKDLEDEFQEYKFVGCGNEKKCPPKNTDADSFKKASGKNELSFHRPIYFFVGKEGDEKFSAIDTCNK